MTDPLKILSKTLHDLRNPLSSILGYGELLRDLQDTPEASAHTLLILKKAKIMSEVMEAVSDILYWKENQPPLLNPRNFDLLDLAQAVTKELSVDYPEISWNFEGLKVLELWGDKGKTKKLIRALMINACVHGAPQGTVTLKFSQLGALGTLEIADRGPGFPPPVRENYGEIFSPGTGLPWAKALVEAQGGNLSLDPEGPGAKIKITLPLAH